MNDNALQSCRELESVILNWLEKVRVAGIRHVGDEPGPPDFAGHYDDERVAIEVTRLFPSEG